jgi:hypothetical protein
MGEVKDRREGNEGDWYGGRQGGGSVAQLGVVGEEGGEDGDPVGKDGKVDGMSGREDLIRPSGESSRRKVVLVFEQSIYIQRKGGSEEISKACCLSPSLPFLL